MPACWLFGILVFRRLPWLKCRYATTSEAAAKIIVKMLKVRFCRLELVGELIGDDDPVIEELMLGVVIAVDVMVINEVMIEGELTDVVESKC